MSSSHDEVCFMLFDSTYAFRANFVRGEVVISVGGFLFDIFVYEVDSLFKDESTARRTNKLMVMEKINQRLTLDLQQVQTSFYSRQLH